MELNFDKNPGLYVLVLGAVVLRQINSMTTETEAVSTGYAILNWGLLIGAAAIWIVAISKYFQKKRLGG